MRFLVLVLGLLALAVGGIAEAAPAKPQARAQAQGKRVRVAYAKPKRVPAVAAPAPAPMSPHDPGVRSTAALVIEQGTGRLVFSKNMQSVVPIASITKLMTALVTMEAELPLDELVEITDADVDTVKRTTSKIRIGESLTRRDLLLIALMSSENRAASALARSYPGGSAAFIARMNRKAASLGMLGTHFVDSVGVSHENVSTAQDIARMVEAAYQHDLIREFTTTAQATVEVKPSGRSLLYGNSNGLVRSPGWQIGLSKTGYIAEAGRCLAMQTMIQGKAVILVLLDSFGKYTREADATRIRRWLEAGYGRPLDLSLGDR